MNITDASPLLDLLESHGEELMAYLCSQDAEPSLAEDLIQDLRCRLAHDEQFVQKLVQHKKPLGCMMVTCLYDLRDVLRRRNRLSKYVAFEALNPLTERPRQPDALAIEKETRTILEACIEQKLPPAWQGIIFLRIGQGMTFREIAVHLQRTLNTVAFDYYKSIQILRSALKDRREEFHL